MMKLQTLLGISILFLNSIYASAQHQPDTLKIQAQLKKQQIFRLRYLDQTWAEQTLEFRSPSTRDTFITKNIISRIPTEFNYNTIIVNDNFKHSLILSSDTKAILELERNGDISIKGAFFTETQFNLINDKDEIEIENLNKGTLDNYNAKAKSISNENLEKLNTYINDKSLDKNKQDLYKDLILIDYYSRILKPASYKGLLTDSSAQLIQQTLKTLQENANQLTEKSNSYALKILILDWVRAKLVLKNRNYKGLLPFIEELSVTEIPAGKIARLMFNKIENEENRSSKEFSAALIFIEKYCREHKIPEYQDFFKTIFPSLNKQDKILFTDSRNHHISLQQILKNNSGNLFIIDLWASWCVPCRQEIPYFVKSKEKFKNKKTVFLSISLDGDENKKDWIKALDKEKLFSASNQYKLLNPKYSSLTRALNINSIPRYILLNDKGNVLNSSFYKPSDPQFENGLLEALKQLREQ